MNNEFINAKDQLFLQQVKGYLESQSITGAVLEAGPELEQNIYVGQMEDYRTVNITFVPLPEDHFEETRLLQFYAPVVSEIDPEKRSDLLDLLNEANYISPLGSFSLNRKNEIGFKYIFPINRFDNIDEQPFLDIFNVFLDCLTAMRDAIMNVNAGNISADKAISDLRNT